MASGLFVRRHLRKPLRRFGASVKADRHAQQPVEYPPGKPLEAKLPNEYARGRDDGNMVGWGWVAVLLGWGCVG